MIIRSANEVWFSTLVLLVASIWNNIMCLYGSFSSFATAPPQLYPNPSEWQGNRQMKSNVTLLMDKRRTTSRRDETVEHFFWEISCHVSLVNARGELRHARRGNNRLESSVIPQIEILYPACTWFLAPRFHQLRSSPVFGANLYPPR